MDEFENISLDDVTEAQSVIINDDYSDMPELESINLAAFDNFKATTDNMQLITDNLTGLLNQIDHTLKPVESNTRYTPNYNLERICSTKYTNRRRNKRSHPEIVNYGTIIYSSLPATQNPHVAKWLNRFAQVLETIYENDTCNNDQLREETITEAISILDTYSRSEPSSMLKTSGN